MFGNVGFGGRVTVTSVVFWEKIRVSKLEESKMIFNMEFSMNVVLRRISYFLWM